MNPKTASNNQSKKAMKTNKRLGLAASVALALFINHLSTTPVHAGIAVSLGRNFTGSSGSGAFSPSPSGAVDGAHLVEFVLDRFAVYSKVDGTMVESSAYSDFWAQAGITIPDGWSVNTPRVVYDPTVERWFATEQEYEAANPTHTFQFLLAVSATSDPAGAWNAVSIPGDPGNGNYGDYVSMGLDAQAVYLSALAATDTSGPVGSTLLSIPKADLLAAAPAVSNATWFGSLDGADRGYGLKPVVCLDGTAGGQVLATGGLGYDYPTGPLLTNTTLVGFAVHNASGPGATLSSATILAVPPYTAPPNALQPDGSTDIVDWDASFTANVYRVGGVLFAAGPVQVGNRAGIRWYRVAAPNYAVLESGTISDPNLDLYFPSIAANTNGTVVIACNGSGATAYVGCYATVGQTVNGTTKFGNLLPLKAGTASYQNPDANNNYWWGLYSTTCVDPADPSIFWTFNLFAAGPTTWSTQITQLLTSPSPQLSLSNTGTNVLLSWPVTAVPFALQSAPSLGEKAAWSAVTPLPATNGATVSVTVPASSTGAFFRLVALP